MSVNPSDISETTQAATTTKPAAAAALPENGAAPRPAAVEEAPPPTENAPANDRAEFEILRALLIAPEQNRLAEIQARLDDKTQRAADVSGVLPEAIRLRSKPDKRLAKAFQPTFEESLRVSIKQNPQPFIDAVSPVIGSAIRRAIAAALGAMLQSLNQTMEHSFSPRGIRWRLEALRTGKPFAEVVLLHTLAYRVEQVFLIHRETGLVLQHLTAEAVVSQDADMVSGMLTALQDFMRDSFQGDAGESLETMQYGELTLWIEQGSQAVLAGLIRGVAPQQVRNVFKDALDAIHVEFGQELARFEGDSAPFEAARPILETCLQVQYHEAEAAQKNSVMPRWLWLGLTVLVIALGVWIFFGARDARRWSNYLDRLKHEPGIVVTEITGRNVSGLRDPLAVDPVALLQDYKLDSANVASNWQPYWALQPAFIVTRARRILSLAPDAALRYDNGTLYVSGAAITPAWLAEARRTALAMPGVTDLQAEDEQQMLQREIMGGIIRFSLANSEVAAAEMEKVKQLAAHLKRLERATGNAARVEIIGHSDLSGSDEKVNEIGTERAAHIRELLQQEGVRAETLNAYGTGTREPVQLNQSTAYNPADNRSVTFKVTLP